MMPRIRRRDFLILGSGGAAYALTGGAGALASPQDGSETGAPLSVGYWHGQADPAQDADVVAAERLPSGDRDFLRTGARITVHGVVEAGSQWLRPELDAISVFAYHHLPGGEAIRQQVWHLGKAPVENRGAPVSFSLPVRAGAGVHLGVQRHDGRPGALRRSVDQRVYGLQQPRASARTSLQELVLRTGRGPDGYALRRGVYLVAGLAHGSVTPGSWRRLQFRAIGEEGEVVHRRLVRPGLDGPQPVDFDYLVIEVESA